MKLTNKNKLVAETKKDVELVKTYIGAYLTYQNYFDQDADIDDVEYDKKCDELYDEQKHHNDEIQGKLNGYWSSFLLTDLIKAFGCNRFNVSAQTINKIIKCATIADLLEIK